MKLSRAIAFAVLEGGAYSYDHAETTSARESVLDTAEAAVERKLRAAGVKLEDDLPVDGAPEGRVP